jgi:hypothetical protein
MLASRICASATAMVLALAVSAHGPARTADEEAATVKGMVTVNGQPLASGRIFFHFDDDQFVGAKVKDGTYTVKRVAPGRYKVSVEGEGIPAVYAAENTTPLVVEVGKGAATVDLDLKK